jgi:hypothetical protein
MRSPAPSPARRPLLAACALLALAASAPAQDQELAEEKALVDAAEKARAAARKAWEAVEAYGRGAPIDGQAARANAQARLVRDPDQPVDTSTAEVEDPVGDADALRELRDLVKGRLHRLDPERHPEPPPPRRAPLTLRILDVQDLVHGADDHVAPNVGLGDAHRGKGAREAVDGQAGGLTGTLDADKLVELADRARGEESPGSVEYSAGRLVTRLAARDHAKVEALLQQLRAVRGGLVDLEVRVYRLPAALFAELRDEALGLSAEAEQKLLDAEKAGRVARLAAHRVVAHDGQQVVVRRGKTRSLVADLEVNQTGVVPVLNPVIVAVHEGLAVEVRPIVDRAHGRVQVDVALSLGKLADKVETRELEKIEVELPEMALARTATSAVVALGKGALLATGDAQDGQLLSVVYVRPTLVQSKR